MFRREEQGFSYLAKLGGGVTAGRCHFARRQVLKKIFEYLKIPKILRFYLKIFLKIVKIFRSNLAKYIGQTRIEHSFPQRTGEGCCLPPRTKRKFQNRMRQFNRNKQLFDNIQMTDF